MQIQGSVAIVTGATRGIGREFVLALAQAGAARIYVTGREREQVEQVAAAAGDRGVPLQLDVRDAAAVAKVAERCADVTLAVNNAGINHDCGVMAAPALDRAREEMETNYFGTLAMCRAFAPVLRENGGGAIINMLSMAARVSVPRMGTAAASKAAALSLTQSVRAELAAQGTLVVGVMPAIVDTTMSEAYPSPKVPPRDVALAALHAVENGLEDVYPGELAADLAAGLRADPKAVEKQLAAWLPV